MANHVLFTGPIKATLTLADGTEVDVRPDHIYLDTAEQVAEVADLIGQHYQDNGHPSHDAGEPFVYEPPEQ